MWTEQETDALEKGMLEHGNDWVWGVLRVGYDSEGLSGVVEGEDACEFEGSGSVDTEDSGEEWGGVGSVCICICFLSRRAIRIYFIISNGINGCYRPRRRSISRTRSFWL